VEAICSGMMSYHNDTAESGDASVSTAMTILPRDDTAESEDASVWVHNATCIPL